MRFLFINQFYPPDPAPTGWYLHSLAQELVQRGHSVKVLCSRRSYDGKETYPAKETRDGVEVSRLSATGFGRAGYLGKLMDYGSYYALLAGALLSDRSRTDLILSLSTPPYVGLLGKAAAIRLGCRHAHWVMDLYPDVLFAHRNSQGGLAFRGLQILNQIQFNNAQVVLSLGPNMASKVAGHTNRCKTPPPNSWIPLWSDPESFPWPQDQPNPLRAERGWEKDTVFLYSGNMGLGHRFEEFLNAANFLKASGPRWVFSGGGKRRKDVEEFARANPQARIEFLGYVPQNLLRAHLCSADVHLASLDSAWQGLIVPSKVQGSFAVGRPVLFVGGQECETASWIRESGGGWTVKENDMDGLLQAVSEAGDPAERQRRGKAAFAFAQKRFCQSENCERIAEILEGNRDPRALFPSEPFYSAPATGLGSRA